LALRHALPRCRRFCFPRWPRWNNGLDFVFFDQHIPKVGLDLEHVLFVRDDHAVKLLATLEANFICLRGNTDRATERQNTHRKRQGAALSEDSHNESIPPPSARRNLHSRGGVRRATSASNVRVLAASRPSSQIAALRRARSGSGGWA